MIDKVVDFVLRRKTDLNPKSFVAIKNTYYKLKINVDVPLPKEFGELLNRIKVIDVIPLTQIGAINQLNITFNGKRFIDIAKVNEKERYYMDLYSSKNRIIEIKNNRHYIFVTLSPGNYKKDSIVLVKFNDEKNKLETYELNRDIDDNEFSGMELCISMINGNLHIIQLGEKGKIDFSFSNKEKEGKWIKVNKLIK